MKSAKAYGINIKHNDVLGFERLATFDSCNIACGMYQIMLCSQEVEHVAIELEEITVLENGDFEYRTIAQNTTHQD